MASALQRELENRLSSRSTPSRSVIIADTVPHQNSPDRRLLPSIPIRHRLLCIVLAHKGTRNAFDYPEEGSNFTTRLVHYVYYPVLLAFQSYNGSKVADLNVDGAAYAVYDSTTSDLYRVVLISHAASGTPSPFRSP